MYDYEQHPDEEPFSNRDDLQGYDPEAPLRH